MCIATVNCVALYMHLAVYAYALAKESITSKLHVKIICLAANQMVECSTSLICNSSSNSTLMSARECCVNSNYGLSYSIPGQPLCHNCIGMLLIEHILYYFIVSIAISWWCGQWQLINNTVLLYSRKELGRAFYIATCCTVVTFCQYSYRLFTTVESLHKDTPELRISPFIRILPPRMVLVT